MSSRSHHSIQISLSLSFYKVTVYNNSLPYDISRVFMMYAQEGFVEREGNEKKTNGKYILEVLVNNSDIFVQNWHPGVLKFSA